MQTRSARGEQKLKPAKGPWTQQVHASPTRPPGYSRENITEYDYADSKYVKAIWELEPAQIHVLLANYSPSKKQREDHARKLSYMAAQPHKGDVKGRARYMALVLLINPWAASRIPYDIGMTQEQWRASPHRRTLYNVRRWISEQDAAALTAWENKCRDYLRGKIN